MTHRSLHKTRFTFYQRNWSTKGIKIQKQTNNNVNIITSDGQYKVWFHRISASHRPTCADSKLKRKLYFFNLFLKNRKSHQIVILNGRCFLSHCLGPKYTLCQVRRQQQHFRLNIIFDTKNITKDSHFSTLAN